MPVNTNNRISLIPKRIPKLLKPYFLVYPIFDPSDVTLPETKRAFPRKTESGFWKYQRDLELFFWGFCSDVRWSVNVCECCFFSADVKMCLASKGANFGKICVMCQVAQHNQTKWQQIPLLGTRSKLS